MPADIPQVTTPEELIGAEIGRSIQLKCKASAYPKALIYWTHGSKYSYVANEILTFYEQNYIYVSYGRHYKLKLF